MKYLKLKQIVENKALQLKEDAAYMGAWDDGGSSRLLNDLEDYKHKLVQIYDLRPSEHHKLDDVEVGEPSEFYHQIQEYKLKLAKNIKL